MNEGKRFEENFKKSIPDHVWWNRYKDGTASWDGSQTRFQAFNICDFELNDGKLHYLFELKSHEGSSVPFSAIRDTQIKELKHACGYDFIYPAFLFNMRKYEKTYCIHAKYVIDYIEQSERKSIPHDWMIENGIEVQAEKKKTNWRYDVDELLKKTLEQ